MSFTGHSFDDRLKSQKEAKLAMLKRAKEKQLDPEQKAKLMEERAKRNAERAKREQEKREIRKAKEAKAEEEKSCLLYTSPSPRDATLSRMPSSA